MPQPIEGFGSKFVGALAMAACLPVGVSIDAPLLTGPGARYRI